MNDLQALKRMNEQPERNVRLDNVNTPVAPAIAYPLANLWLQSDPMHPPRYVKLLLSGFLTPRSLTRDQFCFNCTPSTDLPRDMFTEEIRLPDYFLKNFLYLIFYS